MATEKSYGFLGREGGGAVSRIKRSVRIGKEMVGLASESAVTSLATVHILQAKTYTRGCGL